jgi:hypothetical protein
VIAPLEAEYGDGDVRIVVRRRGEVLTYWVQAGIGAIEFPERQYRSLCRLLLRCEADRIMRKFRRGSDGPGLDGDRDRRIAP